MCVLVGGGMVGGVNRVEVFKNNNPNSKGLQTPYVMIDIYRNYLFLLVMFLTL